MKAISYDPSKDELIVKFRSAKRKPSKIINQFKLWWDDEGNICAIDITPYTEALEDFRKNLNTIQLSGIWKGLIISDEEIKEARKELLKKLEEKW